MAMNETMSRRKINGMIRFLSWIKESEVSQAAQVSFGDGGDDSMVTAARILFIRLSKSPLEAFTFCSS